MEIKASQRLHHVLERLARRQDAEPGIVHFD
jgi:hypothetical protein